jgi:hypothetical protein
MGKSALDVKIYLLLLDLRADKQDQYLTDKLGQDLPNYQMHEKST